MKYKAIMFDLDGSLRFTDEYHHLACLGDASGAKAGDYNLTAFAELLNVVV